METSHSLASRFLLASTITAIILLILITLMVNNVTESISELGETPSLSGQTFTGDGISTERFLEETAQDAIDRHQEAVEKFQAE